MGKSDRATLMLGVDLAAVIASLLPFALSKNDEEENQAHE